MIIHIIPYLARFFKGIDEFLTKSFPIKKLNSTITLQTSFSVQSFNKNIVNYDFPILS